MYGNKVYAAFFTIFGNTGAKIGKSLRICRLHAAGNANTHILRVADIYRLGIYKIDSAVISRVDLFGRENLHEHDLSLFIAKIVNCFFPVPVGEKIGNNNRQAVACSGFLATRNTCVDVNVVAERNVLQLTDRTEKSLFPDDITKRILRFIAFHYIERQFIHIVDGKKTKRGSGSHSIGAFAVSRVSHGSGTVQKNLDLHLPLVRKQL